MTPDVTQPFDVTTLDLDWLADEIVRRIMPEIIALHSNTVRRLDAIAEKAGYTQSLARATWFDATNGHAAPKQLSLAADTPRPPAIDDACAANPRGARISVPLPEYGLTVIVISGSDPGEVWQRIVNEIADQ